MKHSFNADETAEDVLALADRVLRDKTDFINRLLVQHGRQMIEVILKQRQDEFLTAGSIYRDSETKGRKATVGKVR